MKTFIAACTVALVSCYPLRNARIVDGSENEKGTMAVWVCVPEDEEPLNVGGLQCARIDRALGFEVSEPVDAGTASF